MIKKVILLTWLFSFYYLIGVYGQGQLITVVIGDSISLNLSGYNGAIQWQISSDSIVWNNISNATTTPFNTITNSSPTNKAYFRAVISDSLCPNATNIYSSIIRVRIVSNSSQVQLGNWFRGGRVYFTDGIGNGLLTTQRDQLLANEAVQWGCYNTPVTSARNDNNGITNTSSIMLGCYERPIAASVCYDLELNGFSDWILPAKNQLYNMYLNRIYVDSIITPVYWSSTEVTQTNAWCQYFNINLTNSESKTTLHGIRCIREFTNYGKSILYSTISNQPHSTLITNQPLSQEKCNSDNVVFSTAAIGTTPISYQWKKNGIILVNENNNILSINNLTLSQEGIYTCEITNICRTIETNGAELKVIYLNANPGISDSICLGGSIQMSPMSTSNHPIESGTFSYHWTPSAGLSNANLSNPIASPNSTLDYLLAVSDQLGCFDTGTVNVFVQVPFNNEQICLVTVDTISWKNKIIWEKTQNLGTEYYLIYKETSTNVYSQIGNVIASHPGEFVDIFSQPQAHGDKYKISVLDTCANESEMSFFHKSINLTLSSFGSTIGLNWDDYVDESGNYLPFRYYIYKGLNPQNMILFDSVSGSFNSYNDVNVFNVYYYIVGVKKSEGCNNTKSELMSFSNRKDNSTLLGVCSQTIGNLSIRPNPFTESTIITVPNITLSNRNIKIVIYDIAGKTIRTISLKETFDYNLNPFTCNITRGDLKAGVYFIELSGDKVYRGVLYIE